MHSLPCIQVLYHQKAHRYYWQHRQGRYSIARCLYQRQRLMPLSEHACSSQGSQSSGAPGALSSPHTTLWADSLVLQSSAPPASQTQSDGLNVCSAPMATSPPARNVGEMMRTIAYPSETHGQAPAFLCDRAPRVLCLSSLPLQLTCLQLY
jgi:hypothetical protein